MSIETATFLRPCEKASLAAAGFTSLQHVVDAIPAHLARILPPSSSSSSFTVTSAGGGSLAAPPHPPLSSLQLNGTPQSTPSTTAGMIHVSPAQIEHAILVADRCLAALQLQSRWFQGGGVSDQDASLSVLAGRLADKPPLPTVLQSNSDEWCNGGDDIDCTPLAISEEIDAAILSFGGASSAEKKPFPHSSSLSAEEKGTTSSPSDGPLSQHQRAQVASVWLERASLDANLPPPPRVLSLAKILSDEQQHSVSKVATFARDLDVMLGGGVPLGCVTEICGAPGMGKTQMGMQLAVSAQLPTSFGGLGGRCLYLDTEGSFVPSRFREIASGAVSQVQKIANLQRQQGGGGHSISASDRRYIDSFSVSNILDHTHYVRVLQLVDLISIINGLPALIANLNCVNTDNTNFASSEGVEEGTPSPVRVVVIDSIAFHFRYAMGADFSSRARTVHSLGQTLQQYARTLGIAIVVTNQMNPASSVMGAGGDGGGGPAAEGRGGGGGNNYSSGPSGDAAQTFPNVLGLNNIGDRLVPALGDSWAQTVSTRVLLRTLSDIERRHVMALLTNNNSSAGSLVDNQQQASSAAAQQQHRHYLDGLQQQVNELRVALVLKSPTQSRSQCYFRITDRGVRNPPPDFLDIIATGGGGGGS